LDQLGTRLVGALDGASFGGTALIRDRLGLNGGLDKCSFDYRASRGVMDLVMLVAPVGRIKLFAGAKDLSWTWKTRGTLGRDGGVSTHWFEHLGDERISVVHRVTVGGRTIHQHQTHIGKFGGRRAFPDEWIQFPNR
jgi:hypothetical protein